MPQVYVRRDQEGSQNQVLIQPTAGQMVVSEGGQAATYTVVLAGQPTANVTVLVHTGSQLTALPLSLVFTPNNWFIPQTVTIRAVDDLLAEGSQLVKLTHSVTSADTAYDGLGAPVIDVLVQDNELKDGRILDRGVDESDRKRSTFVS
jgi:hypothetical protein